jgi:hypothetical protein
MVTTWSCDGTHSNVSVPILSPVERTASTTHSMKGSVATVEVLYLGYRGTLVTSQDTPGGLQYRDYRYPDSQHRHKYPCPEASHPPERCYRPLQWQDKITPGRTESKSLSSQVKTVPHNTDSRKLLECRPPQHKGEDSGTDENTMETSNGPLWIDHLKFWTTDHVNPFMNIEIISS